MEGASRTAVIAAQFRAAHAILDAEPIFDDSFALALAGSSEAEVRSFIAGLPDSSARVCRLFPCQRARFVEGELGHAVARGVHQYVLLGAGLDSFAWRRPDLLAALEVFEVDHPATQASVDTSKPANDGRLKTGQRRAAETGGISTPMRPRCASRSSFWCASFAGRI